MQEPAHTLMERSRVPQEDKWDVESLYPNLKAWETEFKEVCHPEKKPHWPELSAFRGKLGDGAETVKKFLELSLNTARKIEKLYTYSHLRHDEDLADEENKKIHIQISTLFHDFEEEMSWVEPEFLSLSDEIISSYLKDPILKNYQFYLEKIVRLKPHTLSSDKEELLAMSGKALESVSKAFSAFNNADLKFPPITNSQGNQLEMSHGKFGLYLRDADRTLRKNAFQSMHKTFLGFENSVCEMLSGQVQNHIFSSRIRKYPSCLDQALFGNNIDTKVYRNLIETVRSKLPTLHKYMKLRKKALRVDELHMYDLHVPLVEGADLRYSYKEAEKHVIDSVAPLGELYQQTLNKGMLEERWVDRYENKRKRSGAYSSGCYDSNPFILMNYQGAFHDLMTLAHEAGHSMHSYMSNANQPYQYSHYPIFLAEVASTFNEELMFKHLKELNLSDKEKAFMINQKIEDIRSTFFRQTMFAEFELHMHELAEKDIPLTPGLLKEYYHQLNTDYFGPDVVIDKEIDIEWARIPHFYTNFYVYQYATGISAAHALFEKVITEGEGARKAYLNFLSSGNSKYPLDLLHDAGVNMRDKHPIEATINHFDQLVEELFSIL